MCWREFPEVWEVDYVDENAEGNKKINKNLTAKGRLLQSRITVNNECISTELIVIFHSTALFKNEDEMRLAFNRDFNQSDKNYEKLKKIKLKRNRKIMKL